VDETSFVRLDAARGFCTLGEIGLARAVVAGVE